VTGGYSSEAVISYKSAITIEKNLDASKFEIYRIDITPEAWFHPTSSGEKIPVKRDDFTLEINGKCIKFDAVFIGIHGTPGEDGKLQGYFDLLNLPYTSCDATSSAITFNKRYTTAVAGASGFHVAKSIHIFKSKFKLEDTSGWNLKFPVFVKPNNGGSSIGMSRVNINEDLAAAIEKAFKEDDQVLIEEFIAGREFTIGVFKSKGALTVLPITEITTENEFFDFEAKYQGKSKEITPAVITDTMFADLTEAAKKVYNILNCRGVVRIDFIYDESAAKAYMLEVNTVPGQSEASVIPQQVRALGWNLTDFYATIVEDAIAKTN
jgi:D-alanine-D-alanine ligase